MSYYFNLILKITLILHRNNKFSPNQIKIVFEAIIKKIVQNQYYEVSVQVSKF